MEIHNKPNEPNKWQSAKVSPDGIKAKKTREIIELAKEIDAGIDALVQRQKIPGSSMDNQKPLLPNCNEIKNFEQVWKKGKKPEDLSQNEKITIGKKEEPFTHDFEEQTLLIQSGDGTSKQTTETKVNVAKTRIQHPSIKTELDKLEYRIYGKAEIEKKLLQEKEAAIDQQKSQKENSAFTSSYKSAFPPANLPNMGGAYELPIPEILTSESKDGVGLATAKHKRPTNEDAEYVETFNFEIGEKTYSAELSAVFDGHGGKIASLFAKDNIVNYLQTRLQSANSERLTDAVVWNALKLALVDLSRSHTEEKSGATGNVVLKVGNDLWIANLGDSRAILVGENGDVVQLSEDQKPAHEKYKKGVEKRGGESVAVLGGKVWSKEGNLAVPRGIGDHKFGGAISARPKIVKYTLDSDQSYQLVQACDGVWDVASSNQVGKVAHELAQKEKPSEEIATTLVKLSASAGSMDNISVIVKQIPKATKIQSKPEQEQLPNSLKNRVRKLFRQAPSLKSELP